MERSCPEPEGTPQPSVTALKEAVSDITQTPAGKCMVKSYGGEPYTFERFLSTGNGNVPKAEIRFRDTFAFRTQFGLDDAPSAARKHEQRAAQLVEKMALEGPRRPRSAALLQRRHAARLRAS